MARYNLERLDNITPEKRERVIRVAAEEFARVGYTHANTNIIAKKAGISVGSLFKYFGSKENCFLTVLNDGLHQLENSLSTILASNEPTLLKIERIVHLVPEYSRTNGEMTRLYFEATHEGESEHIRDFCKRFEGLTAKAYRKLMKDAKAEGILPADADEEIYAFCMDNLFIMLQFSYTCSYFEQRKEIYLSKKKAENDTYLTTQIMKFIRGALMPAADKAGK